MYETCYNKTLLNTQQIMWLKSIEQVVVTLLLLNILQPRYINVIKHVLQRNFIKYVLLWLNLRVYRPRDDM